MPAPPAGTGCLRRWSRSAPAPRQAGRAGAAGPARRTRRHRVPRPPSLRSRQLGRPGATPRRQGRRPASPGTARLERATTAGGTGLPSRPSAGRRAAGGRSGRFGPPTPRLPPRRRRGRAGAAPATREGRGTSAGWRARCRRTPAPGGWRRRPAAGSSCRSRPRRRPRRGGRLATGREPGRSRPRGPAQIRSSPPLREHAVDDAGEHGVVDPLAQLVEQVGARQLGTVESGGHRRAGQELAPQVVSDPVHPGRAVDQVVERLGFAGLEGAVVGGPAVAVFGEGIDVVVDRRGRLSPGSRWSSRGSCR